VSYIRNYQMAKRRTCSLSKDDSHCKRSKGSPTYKAVQKTRFGAFELEHAKELIRQYIPHLKDVIGSNVYETDTTQPGVGSV